MRKSQIGIVCFFITIFFGCTVFKVSSSELKGVGQGAYENNDCSSGEVSLTLFSDSTFKFKQSLKVRRVQSSGFYKIVKDSLILNSKYKGEFLIPPVSWVDFENEFFFCSDRKIEFRGCTLKKK